MLLDDCSDLTLAEVVEKTERESNPSFKDRLFRLFRHGGKRGPRLLPPRNIYLYLGRVLSQEKVDRYIKKI